MRCCDQLAPRSTDRLAVLASPVPVIGSQSSALTFHRLAVLVSHSGHRLADPRRSQSVGSQSVRSQSVPDRSAKWLAVLSLPVHCRDAPLATHTRHAVSDPHWGWEPHVGSCMGEAPTILTVACSPRACPMRDGVRSRMFPDRVRGTCMLNGSCARRGMSAGCTCRLSGGSSAICMGGVIVSAEWGVRGGAPLTVERQREPLIIR